MSIVKKNSSRKDSEHELKATFPYRKAVGALMYLMTSAMPNLENPSNADVLEVNK